MGHNLRIMGRPANPCTPPFGFAEIASPFRTIKEGYFGAGKIFLIFHDFS